MAIDPASGGHMYADGAADQGSGDGGGACSVCGRALPPPDLEAVAASIDHLLSVEAGRMVPRTAWAGRAPDGIKDALLFWMPSVKASRHQWERGQQLWTEQMTAALSGPCEECQATGGYAPAWTPELASEQGAGEGQAPFAPTAYMPSNEPASPAATAFMSPAGSDQPPMHAPAAEAMTSAMASYGEPVNSHGAPPLEAPTAAIPAYGSEAATDIPAMRGTPPPEPAGDEHESHTVIFTSMPSLRPTTTRLAVLEGPVRGRQFSLGRDRTTIGRSIGCHVTIEADAVEYDHARIVREGTSWRIELAGTAGDLFVNDQAVPESHPLAPGDIIQIGPARLRFETVS